MASEQPPSHQLSEAARYFGKLADRTGTMAKRVARTEEDAQTAEERAGEAREELINAESERDDAINLLRSLEEHVDDMRLGLRTPAEVIAYSRHEAWANWHYEHDVVYQVA